MNTMKLKIEKEFELTEIAGLLVDNTPTSGTLYNEFYLNAVETTTGQYLETVLILDHTLIEVLSPSFTSSSRPCSTEAFIVHQFLETLLQEAGVVFTEELQERLTYLWKNGATILEPDVITLIDKLLRKHPLTYPQ